MYLTFMLDANADSLRGEFSGLRPPLLRPTTFGLLPPRMVLSEIDCNSFTQSESTKKALQRISIVALT